MVKSSDPVKRTATIVPERSADVLLSIDHRARYRMAEGDLVRFGVRSRACGC